MKLFRNLGQKMKKFKSENLNLVKIIEIKTSLNFRLRNSTLNIIINLTQLVS